MIPPLLYAHMQGQVTTLAYCWEMVLANGQLVAFTSHDQPILYQGVTYLPASATIGDAVQQLENSESPFTVEATITHASLEEVWLNDQLLNGAQVTWKLLNYRDLSQGHALLKQGRVVAIHRQGEAVYLDCQGPSYALQRVVGELYSPTCRAQLGGHKCAVDLEYHSYHGHVTQVMDTSHFTDMQCGKEAQYFTYGTVMFTSGANQQNRVIVKSFYQGHFTLVTPMPYMIVVGDPFTAVAGCDKQFLTCMSRFNNAINFRGEPHVPGGMGIMKRP